MNFERALIAARDRPDEESALSDLARSALAASREEAALPLLVKGAERSHSALLWQWTALLERSLDEHERSLASFEKAAILAPTDKSIAHGHARVALEAGLPAQLLYDQAMRLSPTDGEVLLGYAAALFADGRFEAAEFKIEHALDRSPFWIEGHMKLAQLRSRMGKRDQATATVERAIHRHPGEEQLWIALFRLLIQSEQFEALDQAVARAPAKLHRSETLLCYETIAAVERGDTARADRLFSRTSASLRRSLQIYWIRHLLRARRLAEACQFIDGALKADTGPDLWPYAAIAWRLAQDPRSQWIEGEADCLTSVVDMKDALPDLAALEQALRRLHVGKGEFLDQSVRNGSQTDGPLFSKVDPSIRALRTAIVSAVESYVQSLPPRDPAHPLLGPARSSKIRFSGSWSVLLGGSGYHANHVHPQGWISSALYICVPKRGPDDAANAGFLALGEPQAELGLPLRPSKEIEPKQGRLVLFPSYMWHGTRPFAAGERLTVAFDVKAAS